VYSGGEPFGYETFLSSLEQKKGDIKKKIEYPAYLMLSGKVNLFEIEHTRRSDQIQSHKSDKHMKLVC
jgi:hypothetical protein